jgi:dTDP-4-dehydrorhamnose 3,5-epimerase-like enzyme
MLNTIDSVLQIRLPHFMHSNGGLVVMEGMNDIPFEIARVFIVHAFDGAVRGKHAHRACSQFLSCPVGVVEVKCDDGSNTRRHLLDSPETGLLIPPGIWAEQDYKEARSVLTVLCDRPYDESDYIRNYDDFLLYRKTN